MSDHENFMGYFFGPTIFASDNSGSIDITGQTNSKEMIDGIIDGTTRGLSPEIKIGWYQCTICFEDQETCSHEPGKEYSGKFCQLMPRNIEVLTQSVVSIPKDPRARVTDLLIVERKNSKTMFTWYGFESDKENRRFKHIQNAANKKLITEKIALKFSDFFMNSFLGVIKYP